MVQLARDPRDELYEEYLRVPSHLRAEIINGTLYVLPRPAPRHANAATVLGGELNGTFQRGRGGPGGWWILFEPELQLDAKAPISPDIAGWRVERMPELPETAHFTLVPDCVCEVLSPSTEKLDREDKPPYYAAHGVRHVWLVDPHQQAARGPHARRAHEALAKGAHVRGRCHRARRAVRRDRARPLGPVVAAAARLISGSRPR